MSGLAIYVTGLISMGFAVAGVFFLSFWRRSGDRLFLAFAAAFGLMAINQALVAVLDIPREEQSRIYLLRLAAFVLIIVAILGKNMGRRGR